MVAVCAAALGARSARGLSAGHASDGLDEAAQLERASAQAEAPRKPSDGEEAEKDEDGDDKDDDKEEEDEKDEEDKSGKESEDDDKTDDDEDDGKNGKDEKDNDDEKEGDDDEQKKGSNDDDEDDKDGETTSSAKAKGKKNTKDSDDQNDKGEEDRTDDDEKGEEKHAKKKEKNAEDKSELLEEEKNQAAPRKTTNEKGEPLDPGCYVFMPDGCPAKSWGPTPWKRDIWGEANVGAGNDKDVCEHKRKIKFNKWCGKDNARMLFNEGPPAYPAEPGCFYWHPAGCPAHDKKAVKEWVKDESDDGISQAVCEGKRKAALDKYCGTSDTKTLFLHPKPETPEYPGCYVWMQNGCALHKFDARKGWKRDAWGEDNGSAGQDKAVCEKRKFSFNTWCGIGDTQMLFVGSKA